MKNVLILNGSPRKGGNTETLLNAFTEVAQKENTITTYNVATMNIDGCMGCEKCYSTGKACIIDDDFNQIAEDILQADIVVFAAPVYWYSIPGKIKNVLDRIFALVVGEKEVSGKDLYVISCCEEKEMDVFDGFTMPLQKSAKLLKWNYAEELLVPGVFEIGAIKNTDGEERARKLAEKI